MPGWLPIDKDTPKDIDIVVYAPPYQGLPAMASMCRWHDSAGFCIDELRSPTHYLQEVNLMEPRIVCAAISQNPKLRLFYVK